MYDIDVNGTHNVLEAATPAGVGHVLVTSSTTAYGAFPDNPVPITEDQPVRGVAAFEYARDKAESDRLCQLWALRAPRPDDDDRAAVHRVRPERRQLHRPALDEAPFLADIGGNLDQLMQFVHEDDVVDGDRRPARGPARRRVQRRPATAC